MSDDANYILKFALKSSEDLAKTVRVLKVLNNVLELYYYLYYKELTLRCKARRWIKIYFFPDPHGNQSRKGCHAISVITGRGNNSRGGKARIKPAILEYLKKNNYR